LTTTARRLLRGGADITEFILKREVDRSDTRWLYGQLPHFAGVIWRLAEDGELLAWTDELTEHLETRAAEAKSAALAAVEAKAAEKAAVTEAARKAAQPASVKSRKTPARKAVAARKTPVREAATPRLQHEVAARKTKQKEHEIA
jgi:hypothetical protein